MTDPVSRAVTVLNDALARDREAITRLVNMRIACNDRLAAHETVQVRLYDRTPMVGVLGLINGILGDNQAAVIGAEGPLDSAGRFLQVRRFVDLRSARTDVRA